MGKKLYTKENISKAETERLGIPELVVLKTNSDDVGLEVVHRRYFEDEKLLCPACRSSKTRCSKIVDRQERENMADQTIPDYETIRAAVTGETWAVEKVLMCYKDEIDRQATVKKRQPDGTFKLEIDEDMRQYITMKLIEALPQFPLEEMEREEKRNRDKKS